MVSSGTPAIVCLAHLGWNNVWQRPQQILSRIARHYPVTYVSEPSIDSSPGGEPHLKCVGAEGRGLEPIGETVTAWQPRFPDRSDVLEGWREVYVGLVRDLLLRQGWVRQNGAGLAAMRPLILWFYTPMPVYFLDHLPADVVVYDVMDELASFKYAARDLPQREAQLLARADVVFAGGRSLYEARRGRHPQIYQFLSGVDPDHFAQALSPVTEVAAEIAGLARPILGYYGVIDERIDLGLLRALAAQHPDWSIVMVGPVSKIEAGELPRLPNLHYVGQQPYERLPNFLKGFDVCLMPFAVNDATRSISPTKTLEYMAASKPIVSSPIPDVVANWGDVVQLAATPVEFAAAIERVLVESEAARASRTARELAILAGSTWDHIAAEMRARVEAVLAQRIGGGDWKFELESPTS
ncbi:MAG: glycosyltransferase [Ardenticatenaceae bacterium]|nr:glycosyltransferase [Ardenticatenaceae bacterium]